jgi:hypothetical protein
MEDDIEEAISSIERIHQPNVLAAREALVNASPDTWDLKENTNVYSSHNEYASIFNKSLETVKVDNYMYIEFKKDININTFKELRRKIVNNDILDTSYRLVNETETIYGDDDYYDITVKISNNTFVIQYNSFNEKFQHNISKTNLLYILNKLIELFYSEEED